MKTTPEELEELRKVSADLNALQNVLARQQQAVADTNAKIVGANAVSNYIISRIAKAHGVEEGEIEIAPDGTISVTKTEALTVKEEGDGSSAPE